MTLLELTALFASPERAGWLNIKKEHEGTQLITRILFRASVGWNCRAESERLKP